MNVAENAFAVQRPNDHSNSAASWVCCPAAKTNSDPAKRAGFRNFKINSTPTWLRRRIREKLGRRVADIHAGMLLDWLCRWLGNRFWLDHFGAAEFEGTPVFVSQPYGVAAEFDQQPVAELCDLLGLQYRILDRSDWYPGATFSIIILKPDEA